MSGFACFGLGVVVGILTAALMAATATYDRVERLLVEQARASRWVSEVGGPECPWCKEDER